MLAEDEEQSAELGALRVGEAGEELVFGVALRLRLPSATAPTAKGPEQ
jgi:hypothetical protein